MGKYQGSIWERKSRAGDGERKRRTDRTNEVIKEQKCKNKTSREQDSPSELRRCFPVYGLGRQDKTIQIRFQMIPVLGVISKDLHEFHGFCTNPVKHVTLLKLTMVICQA